MDVNADRFGPSPSAKSVRSAFTQAILVRFLSKRPLRVQIWFEYGLIDGRFTVRRPRVQILPPVVRDRLFRPEGRAALHLAAGFPANRSRFSYYLNDDVIFIVTQFFLVIGREIFTIFNLLFLFVFFCLSPTRSFYNIVIPYYCR